MKSTPKRQTDLQPFGAPDCESDLKVLGEDCYSEYYLKSTYFHPKALDPNVYLIVGRRGAGKTALLHSFSFQARLKNSIEIYIDEPELFHEVISSISRIAEKATWNNDLQISRMTRIWEYVIWCAIFHNLRNRDVNIYAACALNGDEGASRFILRLIRMLLEKYSGSENISDELDKLLRDATFSRAQKAVKRIAEQNPIIIALDTLEKYSIHDMYLMSSTAALIEFAAKFSMEYTSQNVHIKVFMMDEIFPYLTEQYISNTLKYVKNEVYLHWRPKDLMRLISWRLFNYLKLNDILTLKTAEVDWGSYRDVRDKIWKTYFGENIENTSFEIERTFPYVLRHTQLRPRQLIVLCNSIAKHAIEHGDFPKFSPLDIAAGVKNETLALATEIFNAYESAYPNAARICDALSGSDAIFEAKELDRRAHQTSSQWTEEYSPYRFRQFLAELGIVGRVRRYNQKTKVVEADFEYFKKGRLTLSTDDTCVIHPMFYTKLNIKNRENLLVYPFPDHPEFRVLKHSDEEQND